MPTIPERVTLTNASVDVLNAIRNSASMNYREYVPIATPDADVIRTIGATIMDYPALQNEFVSALINRIGRVIVTSKSYDNPWSMFKKGMLDFGETIEEIFVNIAKPFEYDVEMATQTVFQRELPDVRSSFHVVNYEKFYKVTIQQEELRKAFLSIDGVVDLIARITDSLYNAANYDEFQTMKYMLACRIIDGLMYPVNILSPSAANMKSIVSSIKAVSNTLPFMSSDYNLAHVKTFSRKDEQYIIVNSQFDAVMDVEVLASAFNMEKAEFMGHRVLIDGFGKLDFERLGELFEYDPNYRDLSDYAEALENIPAVLVDKDFFMIYDKLMTFTEQYNAQGLYWNYFYHKWAIFSVSPFANAIAFIPGTMGVTSITLEPSTATVTSASGSLQINATVVAEAFTPKDVEYTAEVTGSATATVSASGLVQWTGGADADVITVTATSVYDESVTGTATITLDI